MKCVYCKKETDVHKCYIISGGALNDNGEIFVNDYQSFLDIDYNGYVELVDENWWTENGQFEGHFCNKICIIKWFTDKLQELCNLN